ncbi:MAG: hypothetical protein PUC30_00315 [Lachnospiraceae bacterium]|nr:hypothetical protein [Lachnospiraceae bacterium]
MLQEEYKSFMNEIKPEDGLVEAMVERQNRGRRGFALSKAMKVAVAVMCGLVVLAGGTVVVDAATGGAVRRLFGFQDSIAVGADEVKLIHREKKRGENSLVVGTRVDKDGKVFMIIKSDKDVPVFSCHIGIDGGELLDGNFYYQLGYPLSYCEKKEDYAWTVYYILMGVVHVCKEIRENEYMYEQFILELERIKTEIGTGDDLKDGCAMGVQYTIDELRANVGKNIEVLQFNVLDYEDEDGDGDCLETIGYSYARVDTAAWKKESEETGKMEFEVEAMGGIPGKYLVTVKGYGFQNLYFSAEPIK